MIKLEENDQDVVSQKRRIKPKEQQSSKKKLAVIKLSVYNMKIIVRP